MSQELTQRPVWSGVCGLSELKYFQINIIKHRALMSVAFFLFDAAPLYTVPNPVRQVITDP